MQSQSYPTKESIETITKELNLKSPDIFIQDWECGVADSGRIQEFISYYNETALSSNEKIALIRLILESYNDYVAENGYCMSFSEKIKTILCGRSHYLRILLTIGLVRGMRSKIALG